MKRKTWFVTGASRGLGLSLVKKLLANGYNVAATSRTAGALEDAVGADAGNFLALPMNITNEADVAKALEAAIDRFGSVDVIVNNAGYGQIGGVEELSDEETRRNFDVNVFGSLNVIRQALPHLRAQGSGHVFNISSIGGFTGSFPAFGIYCATKFAVNGFTEALAQEVAPFGINVTLVMPGYFRTNFLAEGSLAIPAAPINAYANVREVQQQHQEVINANQPGDPDKAADVLISVANEASPALHLFLGADAYGVAETQIATVQADMETYRAKATATAFEK